MDATKTDEREEAVATLGPFGSCPLPIFEHPQIVLGHGSGGKLSAELIEKIFVSRFRNSTLEKMDDQAVLEIGGARLAFTTDSFVVTPIFFPGGDIGTLAVNGTVNDLAMGGAKPLYLAAAFILEEGLPATELARVVDSMATAAQNAGVQLVTGDTKVVNRGKGDKVFITTTGIGVVDRGTQLSADLARPGDKILLSGFIGDHGITILSQRENLEFESTLESDCAALHGLVGAMLDAAAGAVEDFRVMRDPTRGGVATVLNEIAGRSRVGMVLRENDAGARPALRRERGQAGRNRRAGDCGPRARCDEKASAGRGESHHRRSSPAACGHGVDEDFRRRNAGRRRAVRRTAAAHLLNSPPRAGTV